MTLSQKLLEGHYDDMLRYVLGCFHIDMSMSVRVRVCLHGLARVALYCKQCYVTWMLHYVCHNNDVIIDIETFLRPFLLFSCWKRGTVHKNCLCFKVTRTRIQNPYYCERLLLEYRQIHVYYNPCVATWTCTRINMNPAKGWHGSHPQDDISCFYLLFSSFL